MKSVSILAAIIGYLLVSNEDSTFGLDNGLALTPPMGWMSWERFTCTTDCSKRPDDCISESLFKEMALRLYHDKFFEVGYEYLSIDDCWSELERDHKTKKLVPNLKRFPSGIAALASYIHNLGLKLGTYGDCGTATCAGYPAQLIPQQPNLKDNYFHLDAKTLADWHIDSFKFDGCNIDPLKAESICPLMSNELMAATSTSGNGTRPVLLICEWPFYMLRQNVRQPDFELAAKSCNAWRYYEDVEDSWQSILNIVDFTIKLQDTIVKYHGPGHWFDPDQLVLGNFGLSFEQSRAQMALWCLWSAPLFMGNDLRSLAPEISGLLRNRNLIGVNQDKLGVFGLMADEQDLGRLQAFVKPVEPVRNGCPTFVVLYLSRHTLGNRRLVSFKVRDLLPRAAIRVAAQRYKDLYKFKAPNGNFDADDCLRRLQGKGRNFTLYYVIDLMDNKQLDKVALDSSLELEVNPSGIRIVRLFEKD